MLHVRVVTGTGGGPDKTILNSPRFLERLGYRSLCAYLHPPCDDGFEALHEKAQLWQAPLLSIPDRGPLDWRVIPQAMTICRSKKVAIWHGHDYKSNLLGWLLRRFWKMKLVTTVHGWVKHTNRTPLYYAIDRFCLPRYDSVLAVSEDLYQQSLDCGVLSQKCQLIENAIDTEEFSRRQTTAEAKRKLGLSEQRFVLGAVGRLSPEKGFDVLIQSCAKLIAEGVNLHLLIVGEGDHQAELQRQIDAIPNGPERMQLLGYHADTRPVYEAMDVFVLSSLREGLPNVLLEAQSLGVPVIATRIAGVPRLIQHESSGLIIEPGSMDALTQSIRRLVDDNTLRKKLAVQGRAIIEQRYSFARRMQKIVEVYDALLNRPAR